MPRQTPPSGPVPARVMIVGEAPGETEERLGRPFVGASGQELDRMLHEAGILRSECFVTNVCRERPPNNKIELYIRMGKSKKGVGPKGLAPFNPKKPLKDDRIRLAAGINPATFVKYRNIWVHPAILSGAELLQKEIDLVKPNIILALGNTPLWALTGKIGIRKWRGSMLYSDTLRCSTHGWHVGSTGCSNVNPLASRPKVLPCYHPAAVLREWSWRAITVSDFRRLRRFIDGTPYPSPNWNFIIRPTLDLIKDTLLRLIFRLDSGEHLRLSFDIETRSGHIACVGVSWSYREAICIPFMCVERREGYWTLDEEAYIISLLSRCLTHHNVEVVGQNILYDCQYTWRYWHFVPRVVQDTMISQHTIFSDLPKSLAFLASMYCNYYVYWKDEGKSWDPKLGEDQLWYYNCEDLVYTDEAGQVLLATVKSLGLESVHDTQQKMFWPVLKAMQRGVRIDLTRRDELVLEVQSEIARRQAFMEFMLDHPLNPDSPKQMHTLFYTDFGMPVQLKRGKKGEPSKPTLDDDALQKLARIEPLLRPLINCIADIRTLGKFLSNFLCRPLDFDGRMRCAFNIGGSESGKSAPKTYRLSSSENAFGSGTNLQNIPSEKSKSIGKAAARGGIPSLGDPYQFPNIREIFIPDPEHTWFDLDLERADLFVVCWEAEDEQLKCAMRLGVDIHLLNAFVITGREPPPMEELVESHSRYADHRGPMKLIREFAKVFCHGTNYGGGAPTMARNTGRTVRETERAQKIWFGAHPGIPRWHDRVIAQVKSRRYVENKFGYRWYIFDRIDSIIPEAIAWLPQSTVSNVINKIWQRIDTELPEVQVLLQVHDSLPGQFPTRLKAELLPKIRECARIVVPYDDPLVIPVSIKTSEKSWGHC